MLRWPCFWTMVSVVSVDHCPWSMFIVHSFFILGLVCHLGASCRVESQCHRCTWPGQ